MNEECYLESSWLELRKCLRICLPGDCLDTPREIRGDVNDFLIHSTIAIVIAFIIRYAALEIVLRIFLLIPGIKHIKARKAASKAVKSLFFLYCFYVGLRIAVKSPVWENPRLLYDVTLEFTDLQYYYYMLYIGWYGHRSLTHLIEYTQNDWAAMALHHIVTTSLVALSYLYNYRHFGTMVMVMNDPADVSLATAKMFKYLGYEDFGTAVLITLLGTWGYPRLLLFPKYILYSAFVLSDDVESRSIQGTTLLALLTTLFVLYLMWYYMIIRVFIKRIFSGRLEDTRSDAEKNR